MRPYRIASALAAVVVIGGGCGSSSDRPEETAERLSVQAVECQPPPAARAAIATPRNVPAPPTFVEEGRAFCFAARRADGADVTASASWDALPDFGSSAAADVLAPGRFRATTEGALVVRATLAGGIEGNTRVEVLRALVPARVIFVPDRVPGAREAAAPIPPPGAGPVFPVVEAPAGTCLERLPAPQDGVPDAPAFLFPEDRLYGCTVVVTEDGDAVEVGAFPENYSRDLELVSDDDAVVTGAPSGSFAYFYAAGVGRTAVGLRFRGVESNRVDVDVAAPVAPERLEIETFSGRRAIPVGRTESVFVLGHYAGGARRDVTSEAYIEATSRRGRIDGHTGVTGAQTGALTVRTELEGVEDTLDVSVWESFAESGCATGARAVEGSSGPNARNFVRIESDCGTYAAGTSARVLLGAHVILPSEPRGTAPCLDLAVTDATGRAVRTLPDPECASRSVPPGALDLYLAFARHTWDLRDQAGHPVAPGGYTLELDFGDYGALASFPVTVDIPMTTTETTMLGDH